MYGKVRYTKAAAGAQGGVQSCPRRREGHRWALRVGVLVLCGISGVGDLWAATDGDGDAGKPPGLLCIERYYHVRSTLREGRYLVTLGGVGRGRRGEEVVPYDDGQVKNPEQRIETPDLQDMFSERYRTGPIRKVQRAEEDPGRSRVEALFAARYGRSAAAVGAALVTVDFVGTRVRVHRLIAGPLRAVAGRLSRLVTTQPELRPFLTALGGTFAWRPIAGTARRSTHSYGIAIDLNVKRAHYWRWRVTGAGMAWNNSYPQEIVDAFEAEGFIWGGRWYHYDTMHFEYRPELLDSTCYARQRDDRDSKGME